MEVSVGISRKKAREFVTQLQDALAGEGEFDITLYAKPNGPEDEDGTGDADLRFSNDDMERPEVSDKVLVSISRGY